MDTGKGAPQDNELVKNVLTHREVLQAAALLTRYAGSVNSAVAHKLEGILA